MTGEKEIGAKINGAKLIAPKRPGTNINDAKLAASKWPGPKINDAKLTASKWPGTIINVREMSAPKWKGTHEHRSHIRNSALMTKCTHSLAHKCTQSTNEIIIILNLSSLFLKHA